MKKFFKKLFGFRKGNIINIILASVYYIFCIVFLFSALLTKPLVDCSGKDKFLYYLELIILFVWLISPALLASDTPYKERLPFFSKDSMFGNIYGLFVFSLFFIFLLLTIYGFHSESYHNEFLSYIETMMNTFYENGLN